MPKYHTRTMYYIKSLDVDRVVTRFGRCKRGEWVNVPKDVYDNIQNAIVEGEKSGTVAGWKTKKEYEKLEVIQ